MARLTAERPARLAGRAGRRRADGSRGALARRTWRRLVGAADRGSWHAVQEVWRAWARDPGDELWEALDRWHEPGVLAEAACREAVDPGRTDRERAAIGEFCARHGLAPADDIQRAVFYVLTGQAAQHGAHDPDGARLTVGYQGAGEQTRALLRQAMVGNGNLDLVRVLGARGTANRGPRRRPRLTAEEGQYLAAQLAAHCEWPALWQLALDLTLTQATAIMRRFGDGWRPADERGRALFGLLAGTVPAAAARARDAMQAPQDARIEADVEPVGASFAPDGTQLLVVTRRGSRYSGCRVFDLPGGTLRERHDNPGHDQLDQVLHLGEAFYVVGQRRNEPYELVRYAAGEPSVIDWNHGRLTIARHPAGFVVDKWDTSGRAVPARSRRLRLCDPRGDTIREITVTVPDPLADAHLAAADPRTGLVVMQGSLQWLLDGECERVMPARAVPGVPVRGGRRPRRCQAGRGRR
jgi:hypothetical protein